MDCTAATIGFIASALSVWWCRLPWPFTNAPACCHRREKMHSAATIAGMAFGNGMLGICHSMAHKLGSRFHVPHGLVGGWLCCTAPRPGPCRVLGRWRQPWAGGHHAGYSAPHALPPLLPCPFLPQSNALLISYVIRFNATDRPPKQAAFPQVLSAAVAVWKALGEGWVLWQALLRSWGGHRRREGGPAISCR